MTNRLMSADFRYAAEPFLAPDGADHVADLIDGSFRMRARSDSSMTAHSAAPFVRRTEAVDLSVGVVSVSGTAAFGVACWHSEGREGYALVASTGGGISVRRLAATNLDRGGTNLASEPRATVPLRDASLGLSCDGLSGSHVRLTGYVDGQEVVSAIDARPYRGFVAGGLLFQGADDGAEVRFDCAQAVVTGSARLARGGSLTC